MSLNLIVIIKHVKGLVMSTEIQRLDSGQVKAMVVQRSQLKQQRDALISDLTPESLKSNPMLLMTKMGDFQKAFLLTQEIERLSDELVAEQVRGVVENG